MELTFDIIFSLLESDNLFPVDFDDAIAWWDCRTKRGDAVERKNLVRKLRANFIEGVDYRFLKNEKSGFSGGSSLSKYFLTIECFKMMGMMVSGERGRQIRQYFIDCEAELKRRLDEERKQQQGNTKKRLVGAMVDEKAVSRYPKFDEEFYRLLYQKRGNGWELRNPSSRPPCVANWTNETVYNRLYGGLDSDGVKQKLNEVNPVQTNGKRKDLHHWHLKPLGEFHLSNHLAAVKAIARLSPDGDWERFLYNIRKGLPNGEALQLNLLEYLEYLESSNIATK